MNRRDLFKIVGVGGGLAPGIRAQQEHESPESLSAEVARYKSYQPRFFTPDQYRTIEEMCEVLLPTDADSPGARDAGVAFFLDTALFYAPEELKHVWQAGIEHVDDSSKQLCGKSFYRAMPTERQRLFDRFSAEELKAEKTQPTFFSIFKRMAIEGFCYSEIGMREYLRYRGETAIPFFPGC